MDALGKNQESFDKFSKAVDLPLLIVSVLWLPVVLLPFVLKLSASVTSVFDGIDWIVWALFVIEYVTKLMLAPNRGKFFKTHLLDLVIVAVPLLRPLRLLRFARLLRLERAVLIASNSLKRFKSIITHKGFHFVLFFVLVLVFLSAGLELEFEKNAVGSNIHSFGGALWWAAETVTTVGYGDKYPVTSGGRGVAVVLMITGIGLIGILTATLASFFYEEPKKIEKDLSERLETVEHKLDEILEKLN